MAERKQVWLGIALYKRLQEYARAGGWSITTVIAQALGDWLDTTGAARLEALGVSQIGKKGRRG